jgi:hypothetical protein
VQLLCLILITDIASMNFYLESELCAAPLFDLIAEIVSIKSYLESELYVALLFDFYY